MQRMACASLSFITFGFVGLWNGACSSEGSGLRLRLQMACGLRFGLQFGEPDVWISWRELPR